MGCQQLRMVWEIPQFLVDTKTNTIWIVAAWTHGMGNQRAWWSSQQGMDVNHTAQLVLVKVQMMEKPGLSRLI